MQTLSAVALQQRLRDAGIGPTLQRLAVAGVLLPRPVHMTADQVLQAAARQLPGISRATVYAALQLFVHQGLLKELRVEGVAAIIYDSNLQPHHHLVDVDSGAVVDLADRRLQLRGLREALGDLQLAGVDVIIRVRGLERRSQAA